MIKVFKIFLKVLLFLVAAAIVVFVLVLAQNVDPAQRDPGQQSFVFPDTLAGVDYNLDSLRKLVGDTKGLPPGFEAAALIAYSAYPQLKNVRIDMILTDYGPPMQANFDIPTLFGPGKKRVYKITLNDLRGTDYDAILLRSLPFDAQVGILAHELGHVAYYHKLNTFAIGKWGLMYLRDKTFRATHERTTDLMPLYHGLGNQIYQYARYVRYDPACRSIYERGASFMDTYYMTDKEIREVLHKHPLYD